METTLCHMDRQQRIGSGSDHREGTLKVFGKLKEHER